MWADAISKGLANYDEPPPAIAKYFTAKRSFELEDLSWTQLKEFTSFGSTRLEANEREVFDYRRTLMARFFAEQEEFLANHFGLVREPAVLTPAIRRNLLNTPNAEDTFHQNNFR
ncbi:hypothetical protein RCL1_008100 [Eukaryota sp. TZLM3-RCL]